MARKSIIVIGAGPIGLEAALYARRLGHDVDVFERGGVGDGMRQWGFVRLFSPCGLNRSALARRALREAGCRLPADDACLTGAQHVDSHLEPLAALATLRGHVHTGHRIVALGREHLGKGLPLGPERAAQRFRVLLAGPRGERVASADIVLDCSGTYGNARALGSGNIPAPGEQAAADRIAYTLQDIVGADRERYAGRRVLLVGSGHSASTALDGLIDLPGTRVTWATRRTSQIPCARVPGDPLPERDRLSARANRLAADLDGPVRFIPGASVDRVEPSGDALAVTLQALGGATETVVVDTILAHVGYRPDASLYRELQVHECYATQGPMKLAATLLGSDATDCLAGESAGAEALVNPEPGFFILGAKSYGRNSQFLIRLGLAQVRDAFSLIEQRPELDLYAA